MVEVFKTNVEDASEARLLVNLLLREFPDSRINFDLQDCDKILRVEGKDLAPGKLIRLIRERGFMCAPLE